MTTKIYLTKISIKCKSPISVRMFAQSITDRVELFNFSTEISNVLHFCIFSTIAKECIEVSVDILHPPGYCTNLTKITVSNDKSNATKCNMWHKLKTKWRQSSFLSTHIVWKLEKTNQHLKFVDRRYRKHLHFKVAA